MIQNASPGKDVSQEDILSKIPKVSKKHPNHYSSFEVSGVSFGPGFCPLFAGPNLVESPQLINNIAEFLSASGVSFLRGGAFKPLTFPYRSPQYTETGVEGLSWLLEAKERYNIPVITEIMEISYLSEVSKVADILQIGTRNMQNYPLLVAAAQTGIPIMLKRGYGASLRDWLGAAEYILNEGNDKVILCERGIVAPHTHRSTSRFLLDLQVVPAAKELTHLPVVTDPSHASFWAPWVEPLSLASLGAGCDGIMLEVHPCRAEAAVDPLQPLEFPEFTSLINRMKPVASALGYSSIGSHIL